MGRTLSVKTLSTHVYVQIFFLKALMANSGRRQTSICRNAYTNATAIAVTLHAKVAFLVYSWNGFEI